MGKPRDPKPAPSGKRPLADDGTEQTASKKLLASNPFAPLEGGATPKVEKKEKVPPFFVKGASAELKQKLDFYIAKGLKCTIVLCTEGLKLITPALNHYKAVQEILKKCSLEYFSHDIEAQKPLKVVLRGLPDMDTAVLSEELTRLGLKPLQVYKMARHDTTRKFRDQLYLVHLERYSTGLKQLQEQRTLFHFGVKWERYKPAHRDVTQCLNCLQFGHGTKNCHMAPRCIRCGKSHQPESCQLMEEADPICANCGAAHKATDKACSKRAEFIAIRKRASTGNQPGRHRKPPPQPTEANFPSLKSQRKIPVLSPLPLNNQARQGPSSEFATNQAGRERRSAQHRLATENTPAPGLSYAGVASGAPIDDTPLSTEQLIELISAAIRIKQSCKTRSEQLAAVIALVNSYGP